MNIAELNKKFGTEAKCLAYLQTMRWGKTVKCPYCGSKSTSKIKTEKPRHTCKTCKRSFSVLIDTMFEHTRFPLTQWFRLINFMLESKKGISAMELKRYLGGSYKSSWSAAMRVRCTMVENCNFSLQNIVEMDEAFIGPKPRKQAPDNIANMTARTVTNKRGRGTKKTPIVGIVERRGKVVLKVIEKLTSRNLVAMLKENVDTKNAIVITDSFKSYKSFDDIVEHLTINHKKSFAQGIVHVNTLEGFWAIVKGSIKGQYVAISKKYLPLYLVQAQYIYNSRNFKGDLFKVFIKDALSTQKEILYDKPIKPVRAIAYPKNKGGAKC